MIQTQLKLKLTPRQERQLAHWLRHLQAAYNWAVAKIPRDAEAGVYHSYFDLVTALAGHGAKIGIPQKAIDGTVKTAHTAWQRYFKGIGRKPRFKSRRNRLNSIAFADVVKLRSGSIRIIKLGWIRFHKQEIPDGHIGQFRLIKRASGWYVCLFVQAEPNPVLRVADRAVGIDAGFKSLLTLSTGEKIAHPREFEASALRLAQAQRGNNKQLASRINERIANQRKDRNHKLSRRLVAENQLIAFSADRHSAIARRFGKSVTSSGHAQLRQMLAYKSSRTDGHQYIEVSPINSTKTCSDCGALSGPSGLSMLGVREWTCAECGTHHDRDINAAINTLALGAGIALERLAKVA
jgi:transposase